MNINLSKENQDEYLKTKNRILLCQKCHGLVHKELKNNAFGVR